ncbi:uncharacterized protein LOC127003889 [Eriocheir sinensis]|uniref:uncharacterized protein LOC127003889 n=1 Tax=Eriocheir sinensis TaxID=95602 RepID=UPI0021C71CC1|nr:uncharacterized protein LOC127003889 [Eriocheir sinensis]
MCRLLGLGPGGSLNVRVSAPAGLVRPCCPSLTHCHPCASLGSCSGTPATAYRPPCASCQSPRCRWVDPCPPSDPRCSHPAAGDAAAATISKVAALEQRVSTPPPVRELSSIPAPAPSSAPGPCPALPSAGEAMDADSGDSVVPPAGQMQNTPATPPAVVTAAVEGTAEPRHGQTGPSPSPADPPL